MDAEKLKKARVLVAGSYGACNDIVELEPKAIAAGVKAGALDDSKEAVAYAESLAPKADE